jgi:Tetratricopeptide repeat
MITKIENLALIILLFAPLFTFSSASAQIPPPPPPTTDWEATYECWDMDPRYKNWRELRRQAAQKKKEAEKQRGKITSRKQPTNDAKLNLKGCTHYRNKDWAKAIKCFEDAVRLNPKSSLFRKNLKNAREQLQRKEREAREQRQQQEVERQKLQQRAQQREQQKKIAAREIAAVQRKITNMLDAATLEITSSESQPSLSLESSGERLVGDATTIDLGFDDPEKPLSVNPDRINDPNHQQEPAPNTGQLSFTSLEKPAVPVKPQTPEKARPLSSRVSKLSNQQLDGEIARLRKIFVKIKDDSLAEVKDLQGWARESQKAQHAAIKASTIALISALKEKNLKKLKNTNPLFKEKAMKVRLAALELSIELAKTGAEYARSPRDREAKLQAAQSLLKGAYGFLSEYKDDFSDIGGPATGLGIFLTSYAEQATRWNLARGQINMINNNLGGPNGKLAAVKALKKFHMALIRERNKRRETRNR